MAGQPNLQLIRSDITRSLDENMEKVKTIMNIPPNKDVVLRELTAGGFRACLVYLDGMAARAVVDQFILLPCQQAERAQIEPEERADYLMRRVIAIDEIGRAHV